MVSMEGRFLAIYGSKKPVPPAPKTPGPVDSCWTNNYSKVLNWSAPKSDGGSPITGYTIMAASTGQVAQMWQMSATDRTIDLSAKLQNKKRYTGHIAAVNANGVGATTEFSGELGWPAEANIPALLSASGQELILKLTPNPDDVDLSMQCEVNVSLHGEAKWGTISVPDPLFFHLSPLQPGTSYDIQCRFITQNGYGTWSQVLTAATTDTVCRPPVITKIVPIDFGGIVEWTYSGTVEPVKFRIKATDGTNTFHQDVDAPNTDGSILGLKNGTEYTVTVVAVDGAGTESIPSNSMKVTPVAPQIPAPVLGSAVGGDGKITFTFGKADIPSDRTLKHYSWEAVNVDNAQDSYSGYVPAGQFTNVEASVPNDITWNLRLYTVTTLDEVSDPSNSLQVHTEKPIAPYKPRLTGAQIDSGNAGMINVSFSPGISNVEGHTGPGDITAWQVRVVSMADSKVEYTYDIADGNARTYTTPKVAIGTWFVDVRAKNAVGWSVYSDRLSVTFKPTDSRPFTADKPFGTYETANYYYAIFKGDNDGASVGNITFTCTFIGTGKTLDYEVCAMGAGGGSKGQTISLGKGGDGGGGAAVYDVVSKPTVDTFTVIIGQGGFNGVHPADSIVTVGSKTITASSGKSATSASDAAGSAKTAIKSEWLECFPMFGWNTPDSQFCGGSLSAAQSAAHGNSLNGWFNGQGALGSKGNKGGYGDPGAVIIRWSKISKVEDAPKVRKKWFRK